MPNWAALEPDLCGPNWLQLVEAGKPSCTCNASSKVRFANFFVQPSSAPCVVLYCNSSGPFVVLYCNRLCPS
eukprot:2424234-Amphidinium_carterae.1